MSVGAVYDASISNVANASLRANLTAIRPQIISASDAFDVAAANNRIHQIAQSTTVGNVGKPALMKVYDDRMVGGPGRQYYDRILLNAPGTTCPLCGVGLAATLDHHLPKSKFTLLTVAPGNLVPACERCQGQKKTTNPSRPEEETLHPYFDSFHHDTWLHADVVDGGGAAFVYSVNSPAHWGATIAARLERHFTTFDLGKLYSVNAANHLSGIRNTLSAAFNNGGVDNLRATLLDGANSRAGNLRNHWETAMYFAAARSDWFCTVGFGIG